MDNLFKRAFLLIKGEGCKAVTKKKKAEEEDIGDPSLPPEIKKKPGCKGEQGEDLIMILRFGLYGLNGNLKNDKCKF